MEFLFVEFYENRHLVIDDSLTAWQTNETVLIPAGRHVIAISLPPDFAPPEIPVVMENTTVLSPKHVNFSRL